MFIDYNIFYKHTFSFLYILYGKFSKHVIIVIFHLQKQPQLTK